MVTMTDDKKEEWHCFRCGAAIPEKIKYKQDKEGHRKGRCPSCKRVAVFYCPSLENRPKLAKDMEEFVEKEVQKQQQSIKEIIKKEIQPEIDNATLDNVYKTVEKWLGIRIKDHNRIDVILATALSNKLDGTPIWLFIVGNSGDWKSAFTKSLSGLPNCLKLDQITENTLASGKKDAHDLGGELRNSSKILLFPDLACLTSMNTDKKNIIWGQFRNLYDGFINKRTGGDVNKAYEDCHVTLIACATQSIRDEILVFSHLGTRELMYDTDTDSIDNDFKMTKALGNEKYEQQMSDEIQKAVCNFLTYHKIKDIEPDAEMLQFLKNEASRLSILRATALIDRQYRELTNPVYPDVPTRLIKQFVRLYRCLKSLDDGYSDEKVKQIITHIVDSSGNKVRQIVLNNLKRRINEWCKIPDIQADTKLGRTAVKSQGEILWNMGVIEKDVRIEQVGAYEIINSFTGEPEKRGGRTEEVIYYRCEKERWF